MAADGAISPEPKHCRRGDDEGDVASLFGARESFDLKNLLAPAPEPAENLADEFSSSAGRDLIFYCYDVAPNAAEDSVLLFGKVPVRHQQNSSAAFASCCVKLRRLSRVMHAVPRSQDLIAAETKGDRQEFRASAELVSELSAAARRARFPDDDVEISACARNYAFGTACERGSRRVAKIKTHVWTKNFPRDVAGEHFSEIRGTRIGCVERAILKLGLRGPEWLAVPLGKWKILDRNARPATWARLEFEIEDETYVCRYADLADDEATRDRYSKVPEPPPLTSLAIEILCSEGRELAVAGFETETGARFAIANVGRSEALSAILQSSQNSLLPIADRSDVGIFPDEISILSTIAEIFRAHDPDIVVGHKLLATIVPTLRERFRRLGIPPSTWSRLGRINFSRSEFGSGDGKNHHPTSDSLRILQGRIACDTFIAAREHIKCASHELSELARTTVKVQQTFCEFSESEILRMLTDAPLGQNLERLVCRAVLGAQTSARVAEKIDLVPRLASKLAAASGYTMTGCIAEGRSRRVGYALAHAFHERNFILPEPKFFGPESENLDDAPAKTSKKKGARAPAYEGGLVLEPKIGLHEECIALLDYKSMYPSIICANDICYTTFQNSSDEKNSEKKTKMRGVLPAVVSDLVKARRRVKEKMKTEASPSRRAEQDAEQLALKIMVNSIYGSLGFGRSPWSFRPMAELVTRLGRETLARTTAAITAEFPGLEIVAGDTDSAMVALKISDIKIARELGLRIADFVNSTRTSSAMEIELADVFERAAFFGKKKYAALSTMTPERTVVRGLDLVRRDWCGLVRKISIQVLARILRSESANFAKLENFAGDDTPTAVACRLCEAAFSDVKKLDPADDLAITKELKKPLGAYARGGGKNLQHSSSAAGYHVEAARALVAAGIRVDVGDAISYIVCKTAEGADLARLAVPVRLHDPKVRAIDVEYYKFKQVVPAIARLLKIVDPGAEAKLVECLGGRAAAETKNFAEKQQRRRDRLALAAKIPKFPNVECANAAAKCDAKTDCMGTCDAIFARGRGLCCRQCGCPFAPAKIRAAISELLKKCADASANAAAAADYVCANPRCGKKVAAAAKKCQTCGWLAEPTYGPRDLARQFNALRRAFSSVRQCRLRFERKRKTEDSVFEDEELKILEAAADAIGAEAPKFADCCKFSTDFVFEYQI